MSSKEAILNLLDKEIDKMSSFYEEKIGMLEDEIIILKNKNINLLAETKNLQTKQVINPKVGINKNIYNPLLKYMIQQSDGIPSDLIDQLCLSSSVEDSLLTMEILLKSLHEKNFEIALYILDLLNINQNPLLFDCEKINEIFHSILSNILVENIIDVNEIYDNVLSATLKLMAELSKSVKNEMISDYLVTHFNEIIDNILYTNNISSITLFMRVCMIYNLRIELVEVYHHLLKVEWDFLDSSISEDDFIFLLWYAYLFELDGKLLEQANDSKKWFQSSYKELSIYFYLNDCLKQTIIPNNEAFQLRKKGLQEGHVLTDTEKDEVISKIESALLPLMTQQKPNQMYDNKLYIINKEQIDRFIHEFDLVWEKASIPLYKSKNSNLICGYTNEKLLFDRNHLKAFITREELKNITRNNYPLVPRMKEYGETSFDSKVKMDIKNASFKWPETEIQETRSTGKEENNLNENSSLRLMGYQITGLTRRKRWEILERAVPSLGLRKVATIIAYNVKLRKGQKNGLTKYNNAITEWEYDLGKLKQVYYRNEFRWPNV